MARFSFSMTGKESKYRDATANRIYSEKAVNLIYVYSMFQKFEVRKIFVFSEDALK